MHYTDEADIFFRIDIIIRKKDLNELCHEKTCLLGFRLTKSDENESVQ